MTVRLCMVEIFNKDCDLSFWKPKKYSMSDLASRKLDVGHLEF